MSEIEVKKNKRRRRKRRGKRIGKEGG